MAISFGGKAKEDDVVSLIAAKKYARAIEVLKAQLQRRGANPSLRMQLADVLLLADKKREAVALLLPLADQFATEGFAAKAVSVLKKVQKIDPGRRDVEVRLARLIEEKQREAVVVPTRAPVIGLEETADEGPGAPADNQALEIGMEAMASVSAPAAAAPAAEPVVAVEPVVAAELVVAEPILEPLREAPAVGAPVPPEPSPFPPAASLPAPPPPSAVARPPAAPPPRTPAVAPAAPPSAPAPINATPPTGPVAGTGPEIADYDLLYTDDEEDEQEVALEAEIVEEGAPAAEPMSAGQFADELMGLVDSVFQEFPGTQASPPVAAGAPPAQARQIVVSPLFRDFSVDEMVAVIEGLKLLSFERGEVILKQGQPGSSLYMLTSGRVRAFRKNPATGVQDVLGDLKEGAFFGEVSILTGRPRMASIVALTRCELLELDRPTLDEITRSHPRVWDVLREFAKQRAG